MVLALMVLKFNISILAFPCFSFLCLVFTKYEVVMPPTTPSSTTAVRSSFPPSLVWLLLTLQFPKLSSQRCSFVF